MVRAGASRQSWGGWPEISLWHICFPLFYIVIFAKIGLVSGSRGLNWLLGVGIGIVGPILFSTSKKVLIFLVIVRCGQIFMVHGTHLVTWVVLSHLYMWVPCIDMTFTSTSTISTGSLHLRNPCKKLYSGWSRQAILSKVKGL